MIKKNDLDVLNILRENAKKPIKKIARELKCPKSTVYDRIRKLEKEIIKKYTVIPDYSKLDEGVCVFVLANYVQNPAGKTQDEVAQQIAKLKGVYEVHEITGDYDLLIKARGKDINDIKRLTVDSLSEMQGIGKRLTLTSLLQVKETV